MATHKARFFLQTGAIFACY